MNEGKIGELDISAPKMRNNYGLFSIAISSLLLFLIAFFQVILVGIRKISATFCLRTTTFARYCKVGKAITLWEAIQKSPIFTIFLKFTFSCIVN